MSPLLHPDGIATMAAWLAACEALKPALRGVDMLSPRQAREKARLRETAEAKHLCDDVMAHLGFERARLGRVELYIRKPKEEARHDERAAERARERDDGRFADSREKSARLAQLKREREERERAGR